MQGCTCRIAALLLCMTADSAAKGPLQGHMQCRSFFLISVDLSHAWLQHKEADPNLEATAVSSSQRNKQNAGASEVRSIWTTAPSPVKAQSFLHDHPPVDNTPAAAWAAFQKKNDTTVENLLKSCKFPPVILNLSLLAKSFCDTRKRVEKQPNSRKMHNTWVEFWNKDVLAALMLRAQAEHMYQPAFLKKLPAPVTAVLKQDAIDLCAPMMHLQPSEFTWAALYTYFLEHASAYITSCKSYTIEVAPMGRHMAHFFQPSVSRLANLSPGTKQQSLVNFWSSDALALYLLSSLVKLLGCQPKFPETADVPQDAADTSASNVLRSPLKGPPKPTTPGTAAGIKATVAAVPTIDNQPIPDDAESAPSLDSHWLVAKAPAVLSALAQKLLRLNEDPGATAVGVVEEAASKIREQDRASWKFLQQFSALPEDRTPWDDPPPEKAANSAEAATADKAPAAEGKAEGVCLFKSVM